MKNLCVLITINIVIFYSTLNAQWVQTGPPEEDVLSLAVNGSNVFAGTDYGVYLSTDNGQNWILSYNTGLGVLSLAANGLNVFAGMSDVLGCCYVELVRSTDNGQSWTSLDNFGIESLAFRGSNVFAGSWGLYLSIDNGQNWTQTSLDNLEIISLAVNDSNVFAGTEDGYIGSHSKGVYLSTDNGQNWTQTSLDSLRIESLAISGSNIFAGTSGSGVYLSTDNGETWTQINKGMGDPTIYSLAISSDYIYAGTAGTSVWRRPLSEIITTVGEQESVLPKDFVLFQNYPNPFNPSTIIKYSIPTSEFVTLKIYDVLGSEVETLVNEEKPAGSYEVNFNASQLSSGIYFYTIKTGNFVGTKKMILLK